MIVFDDCPESGPACVLLVPVLFGTIALLVVEGIPSAVVLVVVVVVVAGVSLGHISHSATRKIPRMPSIAYKYFCLVRSTHTTPQTLIYTAGIEQVI